MFAHDQVEDAGREGQSLRIGSQQWERRAVASLTAGRRTQLLGADVERCHLGVGTREPGGEVAGAAGQVEDVAPRDVAQHLESSLGCGEQPPRDLLLSPPAGRRRRR